VCQPDVAASLQRSPLPEAIVARLREILPAGSVGEWASMGPSGFFPNADIVVDKIADHRVVLIGDAAGANDPSQGHGLSLVFRDIRGLRDLLLANDDWTGIPAAFAATRQRYFEVLRQHARWSGPLMTDLGPEADAIRARVAAARKADPTAGGFAGIFITGPDGLVANDAARRHFLGEDLPVTGSNRAVDVSPHTSS
jgi:2-polyprenyl-6-methoxyphenol hydroxylase-like FAD-dependent oxidoreductase